MQAATVSLAVTPEEFFQEQVRRAFSHLKIASDEHLEFYVVKLLCEFVDITKIQQSFGPLDALETPLALILKHALEAPQVEQFKLFKALGDLSLYFSGFFQDFFNRKTYDIDYYIGMGQQAYRQVSAIVRVQRKDTSASEIYEGLATQFGELVEVVAHATDLPGMQKPIDILATYDRWTRSRSERLREALERNGITPVPASMKIAQ